jgi:DedD protein
MDQGLKERLVGAAVLIAIAVWLIPWVLDGPEAPVEATGGSLQLPAAEEPMPMRTQTLRLGGAAETETETDAAPPATAAAPPVEEEPVAVVPPLPAEDRSDPVETPIVTAARTEPAPAPAAATSPPPAAVTPPKPTPAPAATGDWTVQLGSFGDEANARRLAQRTSTFGYKAEVSSYRSGNRTLYRVRVGPAKTRAEADATASALKAHGINDARVVAAR